MSNVIRLNDPKRQRKLIREQAGLFLAQLDSAGTPELEEQIESWLAESELHRSVFFEMAALWDDMTVLSSLSEVFPLDEYSQASESSFFQQKRALLAACLAVVMVCSSFIAWNYIADESVQEGASAIALNASYATAIGEQETITLPDGSEIILNTNTEIEVDYTSTARNIFLLSGEGFFTVVKNNTRPFRVYAGARMVEAVGTAFTVQHTNAENVEVVVKEGKVNFLKVHESIGPGVLPFDIDAFLLRDSSVSLVAGEYAAALNDQTGMVEKQQIRQDEIDVKLAWTHGMLLFQGDTLKVVLEEVSRYTTIRVEADEAVQNTIVQAYIKAGDLDGLLLSMKNNLNLDANYIENNHIVLSAGN